MDSLNYIKGFRYELHCMARELRSSHCVVWVQCDKELAELWNQDRSEENRYEEALYVNFVCYSHNDHITVLTCVQIF